MTHKELVKSVHPDAQIQVYDGTPPSIWYIFRNTNILLGEGRSPLAAWVDASQKLSATDRGQIFNNEESHAQAE